MYKKKYLWMKILFFHTFIKCLGNVLKKLLNIKILRTSADALTAGDAGRRFSAVFGGLCVLLFCVVVQVLLSVIEVAEQLGNINGHRTTLCTVTASGAGNKILFLHYVADLLDGGMLCFAERLEILHVADVIVHLLHIAHTRKNHHYSVKACGETDGVACVASAAKGGKYLLSFARKIYKGTALDRLHNDNWLSELLADLKAFSALNAAGIVVEIVELDLNHFNVGVVCKNLFKNDGFVVK